MIVPKSPAAPWCPKKIFHNKEPGGRDLLGEMWQVR